MKQKSKVIYSMKIMKDLLDKGIFPESIKQNPTNPEYLCWTYTVDDKLTQALDEIFKKGANQNG